MLMHNYDLCVCNALASVHSFIVFLLEFGNPFMQKCRPFPSGRHIAKLDAISLDYLNKRPVIKHCCCPQAPGNGGELERQGRWFCLSLMFINERYFLQASFLLSSRCILFTILLDRFLATPCAYGYPHPLRLQRGHLSLEISWRLEFRIWSLDE